MTASAAGLFAAYTQASALPTRSFVVAGADFTPGHQLTAQDLKLVALDLADAQARVAFSDLATLEGATVIGPLTAGQLVYVSDVAKPLGAQERAQISLPVPASRAHNGELRPGEKVDVIVTYLDGSVPVTSTVAFDAVVVRVFGAGTTLSSTGPLTVVLSVPPERLEAVAEAGAAGTVTLARVTGLERTSAVVEPAG